MDQIIDFIGHVSAAQMMDVLIAIAIVLGFRLCSSPLSYIIIRMIKIKDKKPKRVKDSVFYMPLKVFFAILGVYVAVLFLREPFNISPGFMKVAYKIFAIVSTITFAKGLAASFTPQSSLYKKIKRMTNRDMEDNMFDFVLKLVRFIIYIIAIFVVITILGINLNGLVAGLGIGGVIVTLAAQDTAKNLFGGLVIFLDKPFAVGDWIQMGEYEGTVEDITFRSTRVRTFENSIVNIPNSVMSGSSIINWSKMEKRRYRTNLCVELNTPLDKLERFESRVEDMLQARDAIYDDSIIVKLNNITDNGLNILICSFTDSVDYNSYIAEREDINYKIMRILREEKIELAYDTKTVCVKNS